MQPIAAYLCLLAAIVFEVSGTLLLPASQNFTNAKATISLVLLYGISFYFLSIVVNFIPIAIMYATWSGLGIFTLALVSYFAFNQSLNFWSVIGTILNKKLDGLENYNNVKIVDPIKSLISSKKNFVDYLHLTPKGNEVLASEIAKFVN